MNRREMKHLMSAFGAGMLLLLQSCATPSGGDVTGEVRLLRGYPTDEPGIEQGVAAAYAGLCGDRMLMAGGCNFPEVPVVEGGTKRYYQAIYAAPARVDADSTVQWRRVGALPREAAYGLTLSVGRSMICIGGMNGGGRLRDVWRITLPEGADCVQVDTLPAFPHAVDNACGACIDSVLYVVGGHLDGVPSNALYTLSLRDPGQGWQRQADFPGVPRTQAVCSVSDRTGSPVLYLWSGFAAAHEGHAPTLCTDGLAYDPSTGRWSSLPAPEDENHSPVALAAGVACTLADGSILCTAGVDAEVFLAALRREADAALARQSGDAVRIDSFALAAREYLSRPESDYRFNDRLFLFTPSVGSWQQVGRSPLVARAGAVVVSAPRGLFFMGGERKPGIRAAEVSLITLSGLPVKAPK